MKSLFDCTGGVEIHDSTIHVHEVNLNKVSDYYYEPTNGLNQGKGINDLSPAVAMSTINEILSLKDKTEVIKVLDDTISMHSDETVKENARSVKSLLALR